MLNQQQDAFRPKIPATYCYYCGHAEFAPFCTDVHDRLKISHESWAFVRCTSCQAALLSPRPDTADLPRYYPTHYTFEPGKQPGKLRRLFSFAEFQFFYRWFYEAQVSITLRLLGNPAPENLRLLDVGYGSGLLLNNFKQRGFKNAEGVEMRQSAVDHVNEVFGITARVIELDQLEITYGENAFDVITMFHLIEHITNPAVIVAQCFTLLKPGGALIIAVPLSDGPLIRLRGNRAVTLTEAPRHVSLPSHASLMQLCKTTGFNRFAHHSDSALNCAAYYGLTFFPEGCTTSQHTVSRLLPLINRALMAASAFACLPLVLLINRVMKKPDAMIFAAFKPA